MSDDAKRSYNGIPLGTGVRKQIAHEYTYRIRAGQQEKYAYNVPTDPQSPAQLSCRALFAAAVAAWKALDPQDRPVPPKDFVGSALNWYVRLYMRGEL